MLVEDLDFLIYLCSAILYMCITGDMKQQMSSINLSELKMYDYI